MPKKQEFDTPTKNRFYNAFDNRQKGESLTKICKQPDINISHQVGSYWLKQREQLGSLSKRRTRKLSSRLGRPNAIENSKLKSLLDPSNPSHNLSYAAQVEAENLNIKPKTLQRNFTKRFNAKRMKKPRSKAIRSPNKNQRIQYGENHKNKQITRFWQWVYFTDEVHFNSAELSISKEYELRQLGSGAQSERLERIQEESESLLKVVLHVAGGISYNHKGPLQFYKDPSEPSELKVARRTKPRKSKYETQEHFEQVLEE